MVHYFYKNDYKNVQVYIDCHWLRNVDLSQETKDTVCEITVTDRSSYWTGTVTCQDLQNFVRQETTIDEINKVVTAGLQGRKEYNGQPLKWKVTTDTQKCKLALLSYMGGKLPYELGHVEIPAVPEKDKESVMHAWMENSVQQNAQHMKTQEALLARNNDLIALKESLKNQIEALERDKLDADFSMFHKFKDILNSKKRRIRYLTMENDRLNKERATEQAERDTLENKEAGVETKESTPPKKEAVRGRKRKAGTQSSTTQSTQDDNMPSQTSTVISSSSSETDDGELDIPRTRRRVIVPQADPSYKRKAR
ncbi:hypothetical protein LRAMOSA01731 [Lichtheimia ramosa]|uniref:DNA repair protein XRCC4 n=1 Tax=Lichtheimia ramosa TaxID=688394 RepID=A0A077WM78_9FUNG|nr:hypothetical protein LRAMOSA01731 [Lichtheimia ramosa]